MLRSNDLHNHTFDPVNPSRDIIANIAWEIRSQTHSTLSASLGQLVFNRDMLFDLKYVMDWETIRRHKYAQMEKDNHRENSKRWEFTYKVWSNVLIKRDHLHILRKTELRNRGPYIVKEVNNEQGKITMTDEQSIPTQNLPIRWVRPFYEK